jgi:hypothetical protein
MKRHISPATVIATVALFVALGGSSLAAANYIDGASIKPNSIPANRLTQSAVIELRGNRALATAAVCPPDCGISGLAIHQIPGTTVEIKAGMPNTLQYADAYCPDTGIDAHTILVGGGFRFDTEKADTAKFVLVASESRTVAPSTPVWYWRISGYYRDANPKDPPLPLNALAMCLRSLRPS